MTLMDVLKNGNWYRNLRVVNGRRSMVWDYEDKIWKIEDRNTCVLVSTEDEELAVKYLLYEEM